MVQTKFTEIKRADNIHLFIQLLFLQYFTRCLGQHHNKEGHEVNHISIGQEDTERSLFVNSGIFMKKIQKNLQTNY